MTKLVFILSVMAFIPDGCASHEYGETPDVACVSWECEYGCGCTLSDDRSTPEYDGQTWHERYVEDHCAACPECCAIEDSGCGEGLVDDAMFCTPSACPGTDCPCVEGIDGEWVVNATLSFDDSEEL